MRIELNPRNPPPIKSAGRIMSKDSVDIENAIAQKSENEWCAFHFDSKEEARRAQNMICQRRKRDRDLKNNRYSAVATRLIGNTLWVLCLPEKD